MPDLRPSIALLAGSVLLFCSTAPPAFAQSAVFTERDVAFRNGDAELHGTLMLPRAAGRHPAVVFLHGSGPSTRAGARGYAEEFARLGVASLFFDKRGSGKSSGSWMTSSLHDLAGDAVAAVQLAQSDPAIDPTRVGLWGVSQAGWVATLAASQTSHIAFLVLNSGGGATPRESEMFSYEREFERAALPPAERAEAMGVIDAYFAFLATGVGRAELVTRLKAASSSRWYKLAPLDEILPSQANQENWSWVATWDPAPHIAKLNVPMLLMFGDRDTSHPTDVAVRKWREGLAAAGNTRATVMVFPGADHGIRMREGFSGKGRPPFADGYQEATLGWLWLNVVNGKR